MVSFKYAYAYSCAADIGDGYQVSAPENMFTFVAHSTVSRIYSSHVFVSHKSIPYQDIYPVSL